MSKLLIVRHGQASFGAADYDQLSELGAQQSLRLGEYLAEHGTTIDAVYCGPAKRHRQTLEALSGAAGLQLPDSEIVDGLAEFPAFRLVAKHAPGDELASFQKVIDQWMHGHLNCGEIETAATFRARVEEALEMICRAQGRGKTTLVVTSGGPTMAAAMHALNLAPAKAAELLWVIANSSVSEFHYRNESLSLIGFNRVGHLLPDQITYR
jgi:broad specificity phosphatase PhoE